MIWIFPVFFPLLLLVLMIFSPFRRAVFSCGLWIAPAPALVLALGGSGVEPAAFPHLFLETSLHFGSFGRVFLLITALLWMAAGMYASSCLAKDPAKIPFSVFFLLTLCGNLGLTVAQDLASFYTFFALMSFAAYGLIVHDKTPYAFRAGRVYLTMALVGEVMLASAFFYGGLAGPGLMFETMAPLLPAQEKGSLILSLAFAGFGIKGGVILLHLWLPLAHPAAPVPASAVLSGAMIKAGLLGWLQFFPTESVGELWGFLFVCLGLLGAAYGVLSGLNQRDPKTILAYSSVSQMGLMTMTLGFAMLSGAPDNEKILTGLMLFALVHGLAKGALFLGTGIARTIKIGSLSGRFVAAGLIFPCMVLAGSPLTGGSAVKGAMKEGAAHLPEAWTGFFSGMLSFSASGTTLLLCVFLWRVFLTMPQEKNKGSGAGMLTAWAALIGLLLVVVPLVRQGVPEAYVPLKVSLNAIWEGVWPMGLGVFLAFLLLKWPLAPEGEKGLDGLFLEKMEQTLRSMERRWRASPLRDPAYGRIDLVAWTDRLLQRPLLRTGPDRIEERLMHWHTVGVLLVFLLLGFVLLAWVG